MQRPKRRSQGAHRQRWIQALGPATGSPARERRKRRPIRDRNDAWRPRYRPRPKCELCGWCCGCRSVPGPVETGVPGPHPIGHEDAHLLAGVGLVDEAMVELHRGHALLKIGGGTPKVDPSSILSVSRQLHACHAQARPVVDHLANGSFRSSLPSPSSPADPSRLRLHGTALVATWSSVPGSARSRPLQDRYPSWLRSGCSIRHHECSIAPAPV